MKWFIKCLRHYADFSGRARRREYWMFALFTVISVIPYSILMALLVQIARAMSVPLDMEVAPLITALPFYALLMLPGLAVAVRRLHDTGKSGWMLLVALIPIVGGIWLFILMCTEGERGDNRFGADPKATPETFDAAPRNEADGHAPSAPVIKTRGEAQSPASVSKDGTPLDGLLNEIKIISSYVEKVRVVAEFVDLTMDRSKIEPLEAELLAGGQPALEAIRLFLNGCANGSEEHGWWYNAQSLVRMIPQFNIPNYPERILHELINNKSNIWEYETNVKNVAKEIVNREANEARRQAESATKTITEKINRRVTPEKEEEMKSKTPIMEFGNNPYYSKIQVMDDGVMLAGSYFIPFAEIRDVILLPAMEHVPALGGCIKIVTDDDPDLPIRDDHSFHMPGQGNGKGSSLYLHNAHWYNCLYAGDCLKTNDTANQIRELIISRATPQEPVPANLLTAENLRKLQAGMTSEEVKSIIGAPNFVNSGVNAVGSMFGKGQVIGGGTLLSSMQQKEYWLYNTSVGDFQILMDVGRIKSFWGLDGIIEKLETV
jgi:uncharacterized membrane protein YhaH (DUF805 family)